MRSCAAINPRTGKVETTKFYDQLYEAAGDIKPISVSIDTLIRVFGGNEIDRVQVYAFAMRMQALARPRMADRDGAFAHPSLAGIASGSGISGSTAWHGAFRFRHYLKSAPVTEDQPETDLSRASIQEKPIRSHRRKCLAEMAVGPFPSDAPNEMAEAVADAHGRCAFPRLARQVHCARQKCVARKTANNFAPTMFAEAVPGVRRKALTAAMARLFAAGRIRVEAYGRPSQPRTRIVRAMIADCFLWNDWLRVAHASRIVFIASRMASLHASRMGPAWVPLGVVAASGLPLDAGRMRVPHPGSRPRCQATCTSSCHVAASLRMAGGDRTNGFDIRLSFGQYLFYQCF